MPTPRSSGTTQWAASHTGRPAIVIAPAWGRSKPAIAEHRGLSAAAGAQDGQGGAFFHSEREVGQGRRGSVGIGERDLGQLDQRHTSFFSRSRVTTIQGSAVNAISSRAMTAARTYSAS